VSNHQTISQPNQLDTEIIRNNQNIPRVTDPPLLQGEPSWEHVFKPKVKSATENLTSKVKKPTPSNEVRKVLYSKLKESLSFEYNTFLTSLEGVGFLTLEVRFSVADFTFGLKTCSHDGSPCNSGGSVTRGIF
jgi:hypothetical protein